LFLDSVLFIFIIFNTERKNEGRKNYLYNNTASYITQLSENRRTPQDTLVKTAGHQKDLGVLLL